MKRASLLILTVGLILAVMTSVAVAKQINGTDGPNKLVGTNNNDVISGAGGNDNINGRLGNDRLLGGTGADTVSGKGGADELFGGPDADLLYNDDGADEAWGAGGNDRIYALNDEQEDFVNCGAGGRDRASVQANDYVDGQQADTITVTTLGLSCETIVVNGVVVINNPLPTS